MGPHNEHIMYKYFQVRQAEQMKALEAERKREQEQHSQMLEEREEVRLRVDRLLEEVARIEASVESEA